MYRDYPFLKDYDPAKVESKTNLSSAYWDYVGSVSIEAAAISLELAYFLYFMCENLAPQSILDLGSGFSSYVTRLYRKQSNLNCATLSVDSDEGWLDKTSSYLATHSLPVDHLASWEEFQSRDNTKFDLVLHDLGGPGRVESAGRVLESVDSKGTLIIDDMHKPKFRTPIRKVLEDCGAVHYDLSRLTLDKFDRYSWMVSGINSQ